MTTSLSREIATQVSSLHREIPVEVEHVARLHLLDALGVGAAGARRGPLRQLGRLAASQPGGRSTVLGSPVAATAPVAALLNGSFIHSLEFDDTHVASVVHGSSVVAAAGLAVAEDVGATGQDLVSAFTLGWEVLVRMGLASAGILQARGFQTTSVVGPFGAAVVSSLLHGDPLEVMVDAFGIAGSQPGGTFAFLEGGDTVKAGQPAWAAHSGLWAAELARAGMTGPERVLEGPRGFYALYADDPDAPARLRTELADLGHRWHLQDAAFKLIPCCHFIHPFVEALDRVLARGLKAADVTSIHCFVPDGAVPVIAAPWPSRQRPATPHDARWSLPYVLAALVVDGHVDLDLFQSPLDDRHLAVAQRVTYETWHGSNFPDRYAARVRVTTIDGRVVEERVDDVLGGPRRPVAAELVIAKARRNLCRAEMSDDQAARLVGELTGSGAPDLSIVRGSLMSLGKVAS